MSRITLIALRKNKTAHASLRQTHPELSKSWHPTKNGDITPDDVWSDLSLEVWWKCPRCGREWQERIQRRAIVGRGCAGCSGKAVVPGFNDVATVNPDILREWDYELNNAINLYPTKITKGSHAMVNWKCKEGHRWAAEMNNRSKGQSCPYCSHRKVLSGFNDLATTHPELVASEWDWELNEADGILPSLVFAGSSKKCWWKCHVCGFSHEAQIVHKTQKNKTNCPVCSGRKTIAGYNDLATTHPHIAAEWHPTKNGCLKPTDLVAGSFVKVWWMCKEGHEWEANPSHRTPCNGTACPICTSKNRSSLAEKRVFYYMSKYFPATTGSYYPPWMQGKELDIFIPSLNVAIEYDGEFWHQNIERDMLKTSLCKANNTTLIRIRENGCPRLDDGSVEYYVKPGDIEELSKTIETILHTFDIRHAIVDVNEFNKHEWVNKHTST